MSKTLDMIGQDRARRADLAARLLLRADDLEAVALRLAEQQILLFAGWRDEQQKREEAEAEARRLREELADRCGELAEACDEVLFFRSVVAGRSRDEGPENAA